MPFTHLHLKQHAHQQVCHTDGEIGACRVRFEGCAGPSKLSFSLHSSPVSSSDTPCGCHIKHASLLPGLIMLFHYNMFFL